MIGYHCTLERQRIFLAEILMKNRDLMAVLRGLAQSDLRSWYVGGGVLCQTVWNFQTRRPLMQGIHDVDIAYFDPSDLSDAAEHARACALQAQFPDLPLDVKNQARVHLWYRQRYGYDLAPYPSLEHAVSSWPMTATSVGVRLDGTYLHVCAPYGLNDLFGQILRPNKTQITQATYENKCSSYLARWPGLTVVPW